MRAALALLLVARARAGGSLSAEVQALRKQTFKCKFGDTPEQRPLADGATRGWVAFTKQRSGSRWHARRRRRRGFFSFAAASDAFLEIFSRRLDRSSCDARRRRRGDRLERGDAAATSCIVRRSARAVTVRKKLANLVECGEGRADESDRPSTSSARGPTGRRGDKLDRPSTLSVG